MKDDFSVGDTGGSIEKTRLLPIGVEPHSRPQSHLGAWERGPGGSGDTEFDVLDFRTSVHFRFKSKLEDSLLKSFESPKCPVTDTSARVSERY